MDPGLSTQERQLCQLLRDLPKKHNNKYTPTAERALLESLFWSLARGDNNYMRMLFPRGPPSHAHEEWNLREAQGAVEGAEYSEAARGKPCGHIFKSGEATYRCKTCTADDTCVLCSKCFESSDHTGHMVFVNISPGNSGCCDCGDAEAWRVPVLCAIHTDTGHNSNAAGKTPESSLPSDLVEGINMTIGRAIDYLCDIISCSPEQLRLPKSERTIKLDEEASRLTSQYYMGGDEAEETPEFALVLWNDEKHTVTEVEHQVSRACKKSQSFGKERASETHEIGRSIIKYSHNVEELLQVSKIIEHIKVTVTIRSARDTFREQMCGTIIEWLGDIAGCSVGSNHNILRYTICKELLAPWRAGSEASNAEIGKNGIDDHERDDSNAQRRLEIAQNALFAQVTEAGGTIGVALLNTNDDDTETEVDDDVDQLQHDHDGDIEMRTGDDDTEVLEATLAGYPPPPPPPPLNRQRGFMPSSAADQDALLLQNAYDKAYAFLKIPRTPGNKYALGHIPLPPKHWLDKPQAYGATASAPDYENLWKRLRLDWLILFDLRMWKKARIDLRDLYISTVVAIPQFKRVLGLRFAGLYTTLAQLYLIADREPDHSIINLSLQMLTTPSITEEVVERGNFLTNLIAILYTFLTTRQVGHPHEVDAKATLAFDAGSLTNRRMYHFFMDMRHLFQSEKVQERLRNENQYMLQFLDLVKLSQGICPNVRATGDHVEYETDAWISASLITRELNRLVRQFAESFKWRLGEDRTPIYKAIRCATMAAVRSSMGAERKRFSQAEVKEEVRFKSLTGFEFDLDYNGRPKSYRVVNFVVERKPISFHHALHYTLSWLIECGKSMEKLQLHNLLQEAAEDVRTDPSSNISGSPSKYTSEDLLLAVFDFPLRVCAWFAQMKAGMWVRNGLSLKHQWQTYRGVSQRDVTHNRDIFLLQAALVLCDDPSRFLATMIDRYAMDDWMKGRYEIRSGYEENHVIDVAEEFIHLMIILLSDRISLLSPEDEPRPQILAMKRDIAHVLCFKPLSFSELCSRITEKFQEHQEFNAILENMTNYRPPEGLSDTGTFELKPQFLEEVDPYTSYFSKNQREESEIAYRTRVAKTTGKPMSEIVFEPRLIPIRAGIFTGLADFTRTALFAQVIFYSLAYPLQAKAATPKISESRVEAYLQVVLHLILLAIAEDNTDETTDTHYHFQLSFVVLAMQQTPKVGVDGLRSIVEILQRLLTQEEFKACHPKILLIFKRMREKRPRHFASKVGPQTDQMDYDSSVADVERKKKLALQRQARVMAQFQQQQQSFLQAQDSTWLDEDLPDTMSTSSEKADDQGKTWVYSSGTCIFCQEQTNDSKLYGTFGLITDSNILRQTDMEDRDYVAEVLETPDSLDRSAELIRPFGVASMNKDVIRKLTPDGTELVTVRQGLGKGFPPNSAKRGPVATSCGHIMHYSCFEVNAHATARRQGHQIARQHPEILAKKEFVCPLCKALGNVFLPIIWRGKEEVYPGILNTEQSFDEWLLSQKLGQFPTEMAPEVPRQESQPSYFDRFLQYSSKAVIPPIANKFEYLVRPTTNTTPTPSSVNNPSPAFMSIEALLQQTADGPVTPTQMATPTPSVPLITELVNVYKRLVETVKTNKLSSRYRYPPTPSGLMEDLIHCDTLVRTLGFTVSATEIVQRGVGSEPGSTLLDKISQQSLTHLRILSETVSSYIAIGGIRGSGSNLTVSEFAEMHQRQRSQLFKGYSRFGTREAVEGAISAGPRHIELLLTQDLFIFFTECSVFLPSTNQSEDIHHVLRLCYLAEIVKTVLTYVDEPGLMEEFSKRGAQRDQDEDLPEQIELFKSFAEWIIEHEGAEPLFGKKQSVDSAKPKLTDEALSLLRKSVTRYALPFLRKAVILYHVRYGIEFPNTGLDELEISELDRLTWALRLPSLDDMFASVVGPGQETLQKVVLSWIQQPAWPRESKRRAKESLSLSHPAIFELVGLPEKFDTLVEEAMKRRCPTTGKELSDPSVCLFCGDIFCSQALCCSKKDEGGCQQHLKKCGDDIGLFINIRKCMVLYLHHKHGSWANAPYLDKYGEADPCLRRNRQLFLNQRRYDALLRNLWLSHGVPTTIARKLEADVNNGGWETI